MAEHLRCIDAAGAGLERNYAIVLQITGRSAAPGPVIRRLSPTWVAIQRGGPFVDSSHCAVVQREGNSDPRADELNRAVDGDVLRCPQPLLACRRGNRTETSGLDRLFDSAVE